MAKGILHTHLLVIALFFVLYTYKTILLLAGKQEQLSAVRAKTKVLDMILGTLILVTGSWLMFLLPSIETWLVVKTVLVVISIPMGIVAMKKENKVLAVGVLVLFIYVYGVAETKSLTFQKEKIEIQYDEPVAPTPPVAPESDTSHAAASIMDANIDNQLAMGKAIYTQVCAVCHGADGKLALNGAKDLSVSTLSDEEVLTRVKKGKGLMVGYEGSLSEEEILAVSAYARSLRR